jgi:NAD(P)-dependent dehydrogenase (short-subunit alcohol dehydrogenase family)
VRAAADQIRARFGGLDILLANAGAQAFKPLLDMADDYCHTQIDVNLSGKANVLRVFAPMLANVAAAGS